jgi:sterol desaturase/sphingolipid hydroxylase (fatty acid hydroxylase superfamily)
MLVASIFVRWNGVFSIFSIDPNGFLKLLVIPFLWFAARDFFYYWFHRLQHYSKWLWAEHALHHSEEHLNVTTAIRHHWLESPLNAIFVTSPIAFLFKPPLAAFAIVGALSGLVGYFIHLNLRLGYGKLNWLLASPQMHRIHHSRRPEHIDKNFVQFFPLWDVIFGTYYKPAPDEFPETGLTSGETVTTVRHALIMPFRSWAGMLKLAPKNPITQASSVGEKYSV